MAAILAAFGAGVARAGEQSAQPGFDQVLAAPDDQTLNIQYAEAEARAGRLLQAAAALERVLLTNPNLADARLLYVAVLYRMDDVQNAAEQLKHVDRGSLSPEQRAEAARYDRLLAGRGQQGGAGTRIGGSFAAGVSYDSDAAAALLTQLEAPGVIPTRGSGTGSVVSGDIHGAVPLGAGETTHLVVALSGYDRETIAGGKDQFFSIDGRLGLSYAQAHESVSVALVARTYDLFSHHYLDEFGGRAQAAWRPDPANTVTLAVEGVQQNYDLPQFAPMTHVDDGARYNVELDVSHRFNGHTTVLVGAGYEDKSANYHPFGYKAPFVRGQWRTAFDNGAYLGLDGGVRFIDYKGYDALLGIHRRDSRVDTRLTLGAPISAFTPGHAGGWRDNLLIETGLAYASRQSRTPIINYDDTSVEARLVWRFGAND